MAGKVMRGILESMKEIRILEPVVTVKSAVKEESLAAMKELANHCVNSGEIG